MCHTIFFCHKPYLTRETGKQRVLRYVSVWFTSLYVQVFGFWGYVQMECPCVGESICEQISVSPVRLGVNVPASQWGLGGTGGREALQTDTQPRSLEKALHLAATTNTKLWPAEMDSRGDLISHS